MIETAKKTAIAAIFALAAASGQVPPPAAPQTTVPQTTVPQTSVPAQLPAGAKIPMGATDLENASLTLVIDQLARLLKLNIIVDPAVKGNITLNTYGDPSGLDARNMLEMILRINGFGLIKDGELYRVIPLKSITHLPMHPEINQKNIPEDDQTILNLVFLKYVNVDELAKVLKEFIGENSDMIAYPPANLLFLLDSRRNMRRTMELISEFDSDTFANQRVRLFEVKNVKPSDLAKDLDNVFKSISLDSKTSPVRFIGVDRINTLIAVASNPGVFENVTQWIGKLDIPVKITAGSIENYVYRVKYGRADCLGQALTQLFNPNYGGGSYGNTGLGANGYGNGYGNQGYGNNNGYGNNGYGNNQGFGGVGGAGMGNAGGYGNQNSFNSNFGGSGGCNATGLGGGGSYGAGGGGYNNAQPYGYPAFGGYNAQTAGTNGTGQTVAAAGSPVGGAAATPATPAVPPVLPPRIIPNPLDNKLIIQANAEQYQNILKILKELDVPPRQILLEAKIYSVTLSDGFTSNITATLAKAGTSLGAHQLLGNLASGSLRSLCRHHRRPEPPVAAGSFRQREQILHQALVGTQPDCHRQHSGQHHRGHAGSGQHRFDYGSLRGRRRNLPVRFVGEHRHHVAGECARELQRGGDADHQPGKQQRQRRRVQQFRYGLLATGSANADHHDGRRYHRHRRPDR